MTLIDNFALKYDKSNKTWRTMLVHVIMQIQQVNKGLTYLEMDILHL